MGNPYPSHHHLKWSPHILHRTDLISALQAGKVRCLLGIDVAIEQGTGQHKTLAGLCTLLKPYIHTAQG